MGQKSGKTRCAPEAEKPDDSVVRISNLTIFRKLSVAHFENNPQSAAIVRWLA